MSTDASYSSRWEDLTVTQKALLMLMYEGLESGVAAGEALRIRADDVEARIRELEAAS